MAKIDPRLARAGAIAAGVAALALVAFGLWRVAQPQPELIEGQMDARKRYVASKLPGRVSKLHVADGQRVKAGDVLFEIHSPEIEAKLAQATAARAAAASVQKKADTGARPEEIVAAQMQWRRAVSAAKLAEVTARRISNLYAEGLIAEQKRDEAVTNARASRDQANAARAQYDMALRGARAEDKAAAAAQVAQASGAVSEAESYAGEQVVTAPAAGEVSNVQVHDGELAPQGFPVITLTDLDDQWAVLNVREDLLKHFGMGTAFRAAVPALGKSVDFRIDYISPQPDFATWRDVHGTFGADLRTFEVRGRPTQAVAGLRPGMTVLVRELPAVAARR